MEFSKRFEKSYARYVKLFNRAKRKMHRMGYKMADEHKLTKRAFQMNRNNWYDKGFRNNITEKIIAEQKYEYSQDVARRFKKIAEEHELKWKGTKIRQLRKGAVDVSSFNEWLKKEHPDWTSYMRAQTISHDVFGS